MKEVITMSSDTSEVGIYAPATYLGIAELSTRSADLG